MFDRTTTDPPTDTASASNNNKATTKKRRGLFRLRRQKNKTRGTTGGFNADEHSKMSVPTAVWHEANGGTTTKTTKTTTTSTTKFATTTTSAAAVTHPHLESNVAKDAERGWLFHNARFAKMCDQVFESVDTDESGSIDEKELYAGLLLIHLKLGMYAGPAACRPLQRERCQKVFMEMDTDGSGQLDKQEFRCVMIYLFGNVIIRVLVQWSMTLLIVPLVAQYVLDALYGATEFVYDTITTLDEDYTLANWVELHIEAAARMAWQATPATLQTALTTAEYYIAQVPESVWNSIPLTLLSTILGIAVVPVIIFSIDEFFTKMASRNARKKADNNKLE